MRGHISVLGGLLCAGLAFGPASPDRAIALEQQGKVIADVAYLNADVVRMDNESPTAQAIAVKGETILAVGTRSRIKPFIARRFCPDSSTHIHISWAMRSSATPSTSSTYRVSTCTSNRR